MNLSISKKHSSEMRSISVKMGLWMLSGFILYFLIMYIIGLGYRSELRVFNGVIQIFCIYKGLQSYFKMFPDRSINYLNGVELGLRASAIGVGAFAIFMTLFLYLNPILMDSIRQHSVMGKYLGPFNSTFFIITEGICISLIGSYILTRIMENRIHKS